jgi:hypothetical protein
MATEKNTLLKSRNKNSKDGPSTLSINYSNDRSANPNSLKNENKLDQTIFCNSENGPIVRGLSKRPNSSTGPAAIQMYKKKKKYICITSEKNVLVLNTYLYHISN